MEEPEIDSLTMAGLVTLPYTGNTDTTGLSVLNASTEGIVESGAYWIDRDDYPFTTTFVTNGDDEVLLLHYDYPGNTENDINAGSTLLALVMNLPFVASLSDGGKSALIKDVLANGEFKEKTSELARILAQGTLPLSTEGDDIIALVEHFVQLVIKKSVVSGSEPIELKFLSGNIVVQNPGRPYHTEVGIYDAVTDKRLKRLPLEGFQFLAQNTKELFDQGYNLINGRSGPYSRSIRM